MITASVATAAVHPPTAVLVLLILLSHHVDHLVGNSKILYVDAANVDFGHPPEAVAVLGRADDLSQLNVHPVVALYEVAIVRLAVLQLNEHGVILCRTK